MNLLVFHLNKASSNIVYFGYIFNRGKPRDLEIRMVFLLLNYWSLELLDRGQQGPCIEVPTSNLGQKS